MGKQSDRTFMAGFIRVVMDQLVQGLVGSQHAHEQNQPHQQDSDERPAEPAKMFPCKLQTVCNIAKAVPLASNFEQAD